MFWWRGALVAISVFVMVYAAASFVAGRWWRSIVRISGDAEHVLFALRMAPLVAAIAVVFAFAIPSFWQFEPRAVNEVMGPVPIGLLCGFVVLLLNGCGRTWGAIRQSRRCVLQWTEAADNSGASGMVITQAHGAPPVALAGLLQSRVLVSQAAQSVLTHAEMERAIAHEEAHRKGGHNFKKLLLQACAFPGMCTLDRAWLGSIELAADANAVGSHAEALDLASALVKIARLHNGSDLPALISGFVDGPPASLEVRVQRLLHWRNDATVTRGTRLAYAGIFAVATLLACNYLPLLKFVHTATEFIVR